MPFILDTRLANAAIGALAAEHLLDCGFRHFAYVGFPDRDYSLQRLQAFAARLREAGRDTVAYEPPPDVLRQLRITIVTIHTHQVPSPVAALNRLPACS